jgi:hypothetical protein
MDGEDGIIAGIEAIPEIRAAEKATTIVNSGTVPNAIRRSRKSAPPRAL